MNFGLTLNQIHRIGASVSPGRCVLATDRVPEWYAATESDTAGRASRPRMPTHAHP